MYRVHANAELKSPIKPIMLENYVQVSQSPIRN